MRGAQLSLLGDAGDAFVECAAEYARVRERVINLIREVAAARSDDRCARALCLVRHDFRNGIGERENNRARRHELDVVGSEESFARDSHENIGSGERLSQSASNLARIGKRGEFLFMVIEVCAVRADSACPIEQDDVGNARSMQQFGDSGASWPAPLMTTLRPLKFFFTTLAAFVRPASTTMAVPCWSSCITGMPRLCSAASILKHCGAAISSRLTPPKVGASACTIFIISSGSCASKTMGHA